MTSRNWLALLCLVAGVPLAAWGFANGALLAGFVGLALVIAFWALVWQWIAGASKPMGAEGKIKPAANAAWTMKDQPVRQDNDTK
jgi:hypothetical protein